MEKKLNKLTKYFRCDINSKYIILNLSYNQLNCLENIKSYVIFFIYKTYIYTINN